MPIDNVNDLPRRNQYTAAVSQDTFDFSFPVFVDGDLVVDVDGTPQSLNTDYTVTGAGDDMGGTVVFTTPLAGGEIVTIYSDLTIERLTDYQQNGPWSSQDTNDELDKLIIISQENRDRIGRAIRFPMTAEQSSDDLELNLSTFADKYLYINSDGELEPAANLTTTTLTQAIIAALLNPQTAHELAELVTPADKTFRPGEDPRYSTLADTVKVCKGPFYEAKLAEGTRTVAAKLVIDEPIVMRGVGINSGCTAGSIISNPATDVAVFEIDGGVQRCKFEDFGVFQKAASHYAFEVLGGAYTQFDNIVIDLDGTGKGGILLGDDTALTAAQLAATNADSWQGTLNNVRIDDAASWCCKVNSAGHTWELRNCSFRTSVNGAHALYNNGRGLHVYGGQFGATGTTGIAVYFFNASDGDIEGGSVDDIKIENGPGGGVVLDGTTNFWEGVELNRISANLTQFTDDLIVFNRAKRCRASHPILNNPTGGGTLCVWGEHSIDCELVCDYQAATAPITVHASATRALKTVTTRVARTQLANVTTDANLKTVLLGGVTDLTPSHLPVHQFGAWNFWMVTLADDAASSFTLPAVAAALVRSGVKVLHDGGANFMAEAIVDADSGGAAITEVVAGADFEVTTGALAGTTGTDAKVTLSAHTDGKIYLENRSGASRDFTVLLTPVLFQ